MAGRFGILGLALLLAACGGETGMHCEYSGGNLDAIKAQVATLKAGGTSEEEVIKSLGKPASSGPSADGGKSDEYDFTQALSANSSPACPMKTQKVTFIFDSRNILQSMQINF